MLGQHLSPGGRGGHGACRGPGLTAPALSSPPAPDLREPHPAGKAVRSELLPGGPLPHGHTALLPLRRVLGLDSVPVSPHTPSPSPHPTRPGRLGFPSQYRRGWGWWEEAVREGLALDPSAGRAGRSRKGCPWACFWGSCGVGPRPCGRGRGPPRRAQGSLCRGGSSACPGSPGRAAVSSVLGSRCFRAEFADAQAWARSEATWAFSPWPAGPWS